jgi:hypothetical protein
MTDYWFTSPLFQIEPGEDSETNPGRYGRMLAFWIKGQLEQRGFEVADVLGEDWGWCVVLHFRPYMLWIGCGNVFQPEAASAPSTGQIWHCFPVAEASWFARHFKRIDSTAGLARVDAALREILGSESRISFVEEP